MTRATSATIEEDDRGANQHPEQRRDPTGCLRARSTAGADVQPSRSSPELEQQQKQQCARPPRKVGPQDGASRSWGETLEPNGHSNDTIAEEGPYCKGPRGPDGGLRLEVHQEGVEEGEAAVAAVAAAAVFSRSGGGGGATACTPIGAGLITPTGLPRPVLAPFSVSDTSSQAASPDHFRRFGWRGAGGSSRHSKTSDAEAGTETGTGEADSVSPEGGGVEGSDAGGGGPRVSVASTDDVTWLSRDAKGPSPATGKGPLGEGASNLNRSVVGGAALGTGIPPLNGQDPLAALPNGDRRRDNDHGHRGKGHIFRDSGVVNGERADGEKGAGGGHIFLDPGKEVDVGQSATGRRCPIFRDGASDETGDGGGKSGDGQAARASGGARCIFRREGDDSDGEKCDVGGVHSVHYRGEPEAAGGAASLSHGRGGGGGGGDVLSYGGGARSEGSHGMIGFRESGSNEGGGAVLDAGVGYPSRAAPDLPTDASSLPPSVVDDGLLGIRLSEMQWSCSRVSQEGEE